MSVSFGFYNSLNGDRKYNALQMSSIFDGIIKDGVFASIGTAFSTQAAGGLTVDVGIGKAWFNHTWTLNDAVLPLTADEAEVLLDRIDAVVLEVNSTEEIRANSIKIVKGAPSSAATRPALTKSNGVYQYAICYISRKAGSSEITQSDISPMVGTEETPFVTGILETVSLDVLLGKWQDNLDTFVSNKTSEFQNWFNETKDTLSDDVAGNLTNKITAIENTFEQYATKEYVDNATPVLPVQMRYVNQNGEVSETASENTYLQIQNPTDGVWEWATLPAGNFGVEMRTTLRTTVSRLAVVELVEVPVYTKMINIGALPGSTLKVVSYINASEKNSIVPIDVRVHMIRGAADWVNSLPITTRGGDNMWLDLSTTHVRIQTNGGWGNYHAVARVYYARRPA